MEPGIHLSQKSRIRKNSKKAEAKSITIRGGEYAYDFQIRLFLSNGKSRVVDFLPLFTKYVKGEYTKYFSPGRFRKFIVQHGNIYWGRNEDVIFPLHLLLENHNIVSEENEEVLYVI